MVLGETKFDSIVVSGLLSFQLGGLPEAVRMKTDYQNNCQKWHQPLKEKTWKKVENTLEAEAHRIKHEKFQYSLCKNISLQDDCIYT